MAERLPPNPWMNAPSAYAVIAALEAAGGSGCARFVGGCVRDTLLGRGEAVTDVDIATQLTPPRVTAALDAAGLRAVPTGIEHGTITAVADHKPYEITTLRRDVETDGRRAVVAFTTDWVEDAQRRDFRLNALYADPDGLIHDPTGGGLADVEARRIVFVGDAETRIREDYLRILRFFRFLARVGDAAQPDPAGLAACARLKDGIATLSGERIQQEMFKLLGSPDPLPALALMDKAGVLGLAIPKAQLGSSLACLLELGRRFDASSDAVVRLAALLPQEAGARAEAADRLRLSNSDRRRLTTMLFEEDAPLHARSGEASWRRALHRLGPGGYRDRLLASWAGNRTGLEDPEWRVAADLPERWAPPPFPVTGEEIKARGVPEGPKVGEVRRALEQWWIDGDFTATKAEALLELERLAAPFRSA